MSHQLINLPFNNLWKFNYVPIYHCCRLMKSTHKSAQSDWHLNWWFIYFVKSGFNKMQHWTWKRERNLYCIPINSSHLSSLGLTFCASHSIIQVGKTGEWRARIIQRSSWTVLINNPSQLCCSWPSASHLHWPDSTEFNCPDQHTASSWHDHTRAPPIWPRIWITLHYLSNSTRQ